ncbi:heavy-metal-associated domain-containing protein [Natronomonas sp. F2-12]|jgi:copper chaperone CopZ|uniref:Heavy-metal-associated domain-containing protein n=1 Tax=Natronomonas aquatica TaxID=2841590 RepID=A0A9R1D3E2_9EURY|nr:heavy metal-associated domain-containing protein [Natronomonas aquatica]MCQ4332234.1 heavy-metal-associated domain-containing protein [Natronomonas aquatica]
MSRTITVEGMSCEHCERTVEEALEDVDGVARARADRAAGEVKIEGAADPDRLVAAVEDTGYGASVPA